MGLVGYGMWLASYVFVIWRGKWGKTLHKVTVHYIAHNKVQKIISHLSFPCSLWR